jgi:hypothetical protein
VITKYYTVVVPCFSFQANRADGLLGAAPVTRAALRTIIRPARDLEGGRLTAIMFPKKQGVCGFVLDSMDWNMMAVECETQSTVVFTPSSGIKKNELR